MQQDATAESQDSEGLNLRPIRVTVTVPWALHHERPRFRATVERDAARHFVAAVVEHHVSSGRGVTQWVITGRCVDAPELCRRLQDHYQDGFGPLARVAVGDYA